MRQRTMIIILLLLVCILIILWWLTLQRQAIQQLPIPTISPQNIVMPTTSAPSSSPSSSPPSSPSLSPSSSPSLSPSPPSSLFPTSLLPTPVPFVSPPGLIVSPTTLPTAVGSPSTRPAQEALPPTVLITETVSPSPVTKIAELIVAPDLLPGSIKYQYRYKDQTQKFSFEDDNLIIAFPTSMPNRFRLVTNSSENSYQMVKVYDKNVITGENIDIWMSPVFYTYIGVSNSKILLFGGSNDASPQDIISHDVQSGETTLLANDVGDVTQINGNRITYNAFVQIPFDDENPDQAMPVGPEKTIVID